MPLDAKIDFRCTKQQKETYKSLGGAKYLRMVLTFDRLTKYDEIIFQKDGKLFKKK